MREDTKSSAPQFEYDPKPWDEMTNAEKKAHSAKLRAEMRSTPYDPDDDSLAYLAAVSTKPEGTS